MITLQGSTLMGRPINLREDREVKDAEVSANPPVSRIVTKLAQGKKIYVNNIPYDVTWQELKDFLKPGKRIYKCQFSRLYSSIRLLSVLQLVT